MATLTPEAQAVIDAFASSGIRADQAANLRTLFANSPTLVDQLNRASAPPNPSITSIALLSHDDVSGQYQQANQQIQLGKSLLDSPSPGGFNPAAAAFTVSHEIQHGLNQNELTVANTTFVDEVRRKAQLPGPVHDYTQTTADLLTANRRNEATAELAGYNAAVEVIASAQPNPTLGAIYEAVPGMETYIDKSTGAPPFTYTGKPGFTFNADGSLDPTRANNIEAMGTHFFDLPRSAPNGLGQNHDQGYPNFYGAYAMGVIANEERRLNPPQPGIVPPQVSLDMTALRLDETGMERVGINLGTDHRPMPYLDSSTHPPVPGHFDHTLIPPPAPAIPAPTATPTPTPTPASGAAAAPATAVPRGLDTALPAGHPDYPLYQQIRGGVERLDAQHGRGYDHASECLTRGAVARVKENGGGPIDHVVLSEDRSTLFLVKGRLDDPAHQRTCVPVADATQTPVAESQRRADAATLIQQASQQTAQPSAEKTPENARPQLH